MNIEEVYKNKLCTGCGVCVAACPNNVIKLIKDKSSGLYKPKIDEKKCKHCGLCLKVCPGWKMNVNNNLLGDYLEIYTGKSTDKNLQKNASSGGVVTQLLVSLLENKTISGALVTIMDKLESQPFIARTKQEIISAKGSKYCPVAINIALKEILNSKQEEKFAVVGLPCHIQGIRNYEGIFPELKRKIVLHLGLFCSRCPSYLATDFLLKRLKIKKEEVKNINYRKGYNMLIELKDGSQKTISYRAYWDSDFKYLIPLRCMMCYDRVNELSDVSFGDSFGDCEKDKLTLLIVRNQKSLNIIKNIKDIELNKISFLEAMKILKKPVAFKKTNLKARLFFMKLFGIKIPSYNGELLYPSKYAYLQSLMLFLKMGFVSFKHKRYHKNKDIGI
ncbi:MAG: Coenzyme F420 hydrogenase/dehydrogenase, beta subunit C-terminal domain [Candidatus Pacebacteria bacterium]|nr:Coenzyme F420 hydrogenase/dehydrogenase, beta subunit C-terminal domain [Candidatus Paceibacterota bacterium]